MASQANPSKQSQAKAAASGGLQSTDETAEGGPSNASGGKADAAGASGAAAPMASATEQHPTGSEWNVMEVGSCGKVYHPLL